MTSQEFERLIENERGIHERSLRSFDQYLTALSAAALSLTFTYYNSNWERLTQVDRLWFALPIGCFLLALLAVIFSQLTSSFLSRAKIRQFRLISEGNNDEGEIAKAERNKWNSYTEKLNNGGVWLLVVGLVTLTLRIFITTGASICNCDCPCC
jgi:hypothetical protein